MVIAHGKKSCVVVLQSKYISSNSRYQEMLVVLCKVGKRSTNTKHQTLCQCNNKFSWLYVFCTMCTQILLNANI